jgi:hypothetical protein
MAAAGMDIHEARRRNALFDVNGLLVTSREDLAEFQKPFVQNYAPISTFVEAVKALKPTGIIGVSGIPKLFNRAVIETMAETNRRPIIFPYSNPTSRSECYVEKRRHIELALEQARYEAARARRQYDAVDPDNRLVAAELEQRWNARLLAVRAIEDERDAWRQTLKPP